MKTIKIKTKADGKDDVKVLVIYTGGTLGMVYDAKMDKANAINLYKKALSIKEFPETRKKLDNLQVN